MNYAPLLSEGRAFASVHDPYILPARPGRRWGFDTLPDTHHTAGDTLAMVERGIAEILSRSEICKTPRCGRLLPAGRPVGSDYCPQCLNKYPHLHPQESLT